MLGEIEAGLTTADRVGSVETASPGARTSYPVCRRLPSRNSRRPSRTVSLAKLWPTTPARPPP